MADSDEQTQPKLNVDGRVATITLSKPAYANRLSVHDLEIIQQHVQTVNNDEQILVLKFVAEGKYFCSGFDINNFGDVNSPSSLLFGETVDVVETARPITVAAVHGGVYGGGSDLALACDFRFGTENTNMFVPASRLGLHFYPGGMKRYVQRLGLDNAKRVLITAEHFNAQALKNMGFLTDLVEADAFSEKVSEFVDHLSNLAPLTLASVKRHLNLIADGTLLRDEIDKLVIASEHSEDIQEGFRAWRDKRTPVFKGT